MNIADFEQQVRGAQNRLDNILQAASRNSAQSDSFDLSLEGLTEELHVSLEELYVALEELNTQNEELKISQKALVAERKRYQNLFELAPDGYLVTDLNGMIREANWAAATMLGIPQEFLVGKPLINYVIDADRRRFRNKLSELLSLRRLTDWEIQMQPRKREPFPVAIAISTIRNSAGEITDMRWIIRDISQLKQAEAAIRDQLAAEKQLSELKSRIIQTISHEFRTPLTVVRTSIEILEHYSDQLDEAKKENYFHRMKAAIQYTTRLFEGVLILDEVESNRLEMQPSPVQLEQFCQELIDEVQLTSAIAHTIHFAHEGEQRPASFDRTLLKQVFGNLLSNAVNYSSDSSNIYVKLTHEETQVIFQIQDEGVGISAEELPHLFEPFYKIGNGKNSSGAGLGLAIAKRIVDLHGGTITLHSEVGIGTTVTVTLPLSNPTDEP
ncbi:PAS domain-containing sensor histidine kinase [Oculatella sp. FACHB-28]|uniref:PAS domain-containing sensor histidine kinase n=1 Tax=Oculatella sp. FACHB-28 TaxID=2692845 RepID=UPI0016848977|nr:PAS domain-containing sensor histidine kinase [Oculatella sp. FACHB-28]MBD2058671.1 PAS domain-containing sensor histidine kinase [Oculatella sp. FACHB-28]